MEQFVSLNVIVTGLLLLVVFVYLILLFNKRRKEKFLHSGKK